MTHGNLINYKVNVTRALEGTYRGLKVFIPHMRQHQDLFFYTCLTC